MHSPGKEIRPSDPHDQQDPDNLSVGSRSLAGVLTGLSASVSMLVLFVVATELASWVAMPQIQRYLAAKVGEARKHSIFYANKSWANKYWNEVDASNKFQFRPYVSWRRKAFSGQYVNVDGDGIRRTVNPNCSPTARRVWMFGSSALWGTGAKDDETIPSI